jgi:hypothetical protein
MLEQPVFIQGHYAFEGKGLETPLPLEPAAIYVVPRDKRAQMIYFRGGNSAPEMIYVLLLRNQKPMRYFAIGAKGAIHVPLAVVEDLHPDTVLEVFLAAPAGVTGSAILDIGLVEI